MNVKKIAKSFSLISQLGFIMLTPILLCIWLGSTIDAFIKKSPLFTIIFLLLGVGAAFRNLFYYVGKEIKKEDKGNKDE